MPVCPGAAWGWAKSAGAFDMLLPSQQLLFPGQCCKVAVATYASADVVAAAAAVVVAAAAAVHPNAAVITATAVLPPDGASALWK